MKEKRAMAHIPTKSIRASCAAALVFFAGTASAENVSFISGAGSGPTVYVSSANPLPVTSSGGSGSAVFGPNAAGANASHPPVLMSGTQDATGTGIIQTMLVDSSGFFHVVIESPKGSLTPASGVGVTLDTTDAAALQSFVSGQTTGNASLATIATNTGAAIPAGSNAIGTVDPTTAANWGVGSTGSAPPSKANYLGASQSGLVAGVVGCDTHVYKHITSATDTLVVQGVSAKTIKICGYRLSFSGSAAQSVYLENTASANANCSSTLTQIGPLDTGNSSAPSQAGFMAPFWTGFANTSGNGLCANSSGTGGVDLELFYTVGS